MSCTDCISGGTKDVGPSVGCKLMVMQMIGMEHVANDRYGMFKDGISSWILDGDGFFWTPYDLHISWNL